MSLTYRPEFGIGLQYYHKTYTDEKLDGDQNLQCRSSVDFLRRKRG